MITLYCLCFLQTWMPRISSILIILFFNQRECFAMSTDVKAGIGTWAKKSCSDTAGYICLRNVGEWIEPKNSLSQVSCTRAPFCIAPSLSITSFFSWRNANFQGQKWWPGLILPSADPLIPENATPTTHTSYDPVMNDTFRVNTQEMTWNAAKSFCENDGAALASLRNEWAKSYSHMMSLKLNAPLWIGLNRKAVWHRDPPPHNPVYHNCEYKPFVW